MQMRQEQFEELRNDSEVRLSNHKQFGRLRVLCTKPFHLSIGPDYRECAMGFAMMVFGSIALLSYVNYQIKSELHFKVGLAFAIVCPIFYLLTALSNPGIYDSNLNFQPKIKYCHTCMQLVPKRVYHCPKCELCIQSYDHHCPFMSKCIGQGNIKYFYVMITSVSGLSIYLYYTIYVGFWANQ